MHTQAVEDYLKTIYEIQCEQGKVATTVLAERLGVAPASVTGMIKKLADMHLVVHEPYQGVVLTEAGQKIALEVLRHHRLIELFLAEALGVPWDRVHEEANKIEHVLSEDVEDRMDALLGYPTTDPHGAPIPARDGTIDQRNCVALVDLKPGQTALVAEVSDHDSALLRYLGELGLYPQVKVSVMAVAPFDGPLTIRVGDAEHALGREAASLIFMTEVKTETV
ncbi:MAG: metal-dependent transcriptional regulator [Anaerolineae bacterium]|jgi:DtxR family Mn-dependent transcriptional regulator